RCPGEIGPLLEEAPRPVEVVAVRAGGDQVQLHSVTRHPFSESAILGAIVLGRELAAAAPALVTDAPVTDAEWAGVAVRAALVGQRRGAGRGVAVLDPALILLGGAGADVGREVGLDVAQPAEAHELVSAEVVGLGDLLPASETPRPLVAGADTVAPVVAVGET